jgi:hypothetical protein
MAGWMAAAVVGSSLIGSRSASKAADVQAASADRAADVQREMFERNVELNAPFREAGLTALNKLVPLATEYQNFGMDQFQQDPGYAFRMSEGMKGLERSAAARGGLLSGGNLKNIQRFGQDLASQEYQNAFNRYQTERQARLNPLQSLAGVGQTTSQQLGSAGQTMAGNVGEAIGAAGQARASGYMGQANALSGALGQYMNFNQQQQQNALLRQAIGNRGGFGGGTGFMQNSPYNFSGMSEFGGN